MTAISIAILAIDASEISDFSEKSEIGLKNGAHKFSQRSRLAK